MNRIIETIEKEKIVKKHRRGGNGIRGLFVSKNIKSVKLENNKVSAEFNNKPGIFYDDVENDKQLFIYIYEIKEYLKENNIDKLSISEIQHPDFSKVNLFAGEEYNQELRQIENQINLIDFNQHNHENPEFMERKIKEIYNNPQNQELMERGEFPIICFKNIEKIGRNQALEEALLPIFDTQQNAELFNKEVDLSKFILIATTSTYETEKLSAPLLSRLDWVNADTAQPKKFFLDKYYYCFLVPSLLISLALLSVLLLPKLKRAKQSKTRKLKADFSF